MYPYHHRAAHLLLAGLATLYLVACDGGPREPGGSATDIEGAQALTAQRPNILLIMADDLGFNDLAINNGNTEIDTPNLDQLARDGVRYTRHYATAVCSPARAALLTGMHPARLGYKPNGPGISPELITLPERLREVGYTTWHLGKWHTGDVYRDAWPDRQGFDHWLGFLNQWRLAGHKQNGSIKPVQPRYEDPWLQGTGEPGRHFSGHLETILTEKAVAILEELNRQSRPWFLNLWYYAPHTPIRPTAEFAARYPDTPEGRYRAHVNQLDHNIGAVLGKLKELDADDSTIVVVVSDNGGTNRQIDNNAPFAGRKGQLTEGGLRTPLLLRWPESALNRKVFDESVTIYDIYPTLLEALQLKIPDDLDGASFHPGPDGSLAPRKRSLFWEHGAGQSMLSADGRWRLHQPNHVFGIDLPTKLFDLHADPSGGTPSSTAPASIMASMQRELEAWYHDVHVIPTVLEIMADGSKALTGASFQRTPGLGGYSIGLAFDKNSEGELLAQTGVWSLKRRDEEIVASFGNFELKGHIPTPATCHAVVITGVFHRKRSSFADDDHLKLTLYIDGTETGHLEAEGSLPVAAPTTPTVMGSAGDPARSPVILNIPLAHSPYIDVDSFSKKLCQSS